MPVATFIHKLFSDRYPRRPPGRSEDSEPAIDYLKNQLLTKPISPRFAASKSILVSILWDLKSDRRYKSLTLSLAERATKVLDRISRLFESSEESLGLIQNIEQLEQTLQDIVIFVHSKTQSNSSYQRSFVEDICDQYVSLDHKLTSLLNTCEQGHFKPSSVNPENNEALSSGILNHARGVSVKGAQFYNIHGNFSHAQPNLGQTTKTIIQNLRVVPTEDISMAQEMMSRREYKLYSGNISGRAIAIKLYHGRGAKRICLESAKWNHKVMHPSILHLIGSSSADSDLSFLVFDGDYEGVAESSIATALEKDLKQSLIVGIETVIGLSSSLDYLRKVEYSFVNARLENFIVLLNREGKVKISFDPGVEAEHHEQSQSDEESPLAKDALLDIFHGLCQRTFDAARQAHYKGQTFQLEYPDLLDDYQPDLPKDRFEELDDDIGLPNGKAGSNPSTRIPSTSNPQRQSMKGSRLELVWKSRSTQDVSPRVCLNAISQQFQALLTDLKTSAKPKLHRYRGRYSKRMSHRCPGYSRVEITLTADIAQSAIVSHSTPTVQEICPVCNEVVGDEEIFNCICGREDDESMPTIRCPSCFEWHHRSCLMTSWPLGGLCVKCVDPRGFWIPEVAPDGQLIPAYHQIFTIEYHVLVDVLAPVVAPIIRHPLMWAYTSDFSKRTAGMTTELQARDLLDFIGARSHIPKFMADLWAALEAQPDLCGFVNLNLVVKPERLL